MKNANDIWLGDLVRAFTALRPENVATRAQIAALSGFAWEEEQPSQTGQKASPPPLEPARASTPKEPLLQPQAAAQLPDTEHAQLLPWVAVSEPLRDAEWQSLPVLEPHAEREESALPHLPLFRPEWARALVTALAATKLPIGPVDSQQLVDTVAHGRPVQRIVRKPRWSLARGLELLIDVAPGMEPFTSDQLELAAQLREHVGPGLVHELQFAHCPARGVFVEGKREPYAWPDHGVPVLALSSVGIGGPAADPARGRVDEWVSFARQLQARNAPLRVLVPQCARRWPPALREHAALVEWDRSTTAAVIARVLAREVR